MIDLFIVDTVELSDTIKIHLMFEKDMNLTELVECYIQVEINLDSEHTFKDTQKIYDIRSFLNEIWCMETLGIICPLFKEYNPNIDIKEQTMWGGKPYPCYNQNHVHIYLM